MTAGLETFAKVRALHAQATTPGEKAAAAGRMEALARTAGMTVDQAVSKLDAPPSPAAGGGFASFFDTPFFREQMAERDRERAERWREVLAEYGTEEAVFYPGEWEQALIEAAAPFRAADGYGLRGWDYITSRDDPAPEIVDAIAGAYPMPTTVREAWVEFMFWDKLGRDREARGTACGDHAPEVQFRVVLVERLLDTMPVRGLADLRARMSWLEWLNDLGSPCQDKQRIRLAALRADIERMGARLRKQDTAHVQDGHKDHIARHTPAVVHSGQAEGDATTACSLRRTNADKRRDVLALFGQGLSDREVARRAGVSPSTVGNIRRVQP